MKDPGRRLYAELANKKHLNRTEWVCSLDELREVFDRRGRYMDWRDVRKRLLLPAIDDINTHAPVTATATRSTLLATLRGCFTLFTLAAGSRAAKPSRVCHTGNGEKDVECVL